MVVLEWVLLVAILVEAVLEQGGYPALNLQTRPVWYERPERTGPALLYSRQLQVASTLDRAAEEEVEPDVPRALLEFRRRAVASADRLRWRAGPRLRWAPLTSVNAVVVVGSRVVASGSSG